MIGRILATRSIDAWGVAANEPRLPGAPALPIAISILRCLDPHVVQGLHHGPTVDYREEYRRINIVLDEAAQALADALVARGHQAETVPATSSDDEDGGSDGRQFAHKTAATSAGLGWIGKTALFVSPELGSAVRLATVFTDLELPPGEPVREGGCGTCRACVDACPAGCGRDVQWHAGMPRDELFDAAACRRQMALFPDISADICGICIAACPLTRQA